MLRSQHVTAAPVRWLLVDPGLCSRVHLAGLGAVRMPLDAGHLAISTSPAAWVALRRARHVSVLLMLWNDSGILLPDHDADPEGEGGPYRFSFSITRSLSATRPIAPMAIRAWEGVTVARNGRPWPVPSLFRRLFTASAV